MAVLEFELGMSLPLSMLVFWVVTPCGYFIFEGTYCLQLRAEGHHHHHHPHHENLKFHIASIIEIKVLTLLASYFV
jgi:hypothetical protein